MYQIRQSVASWSAADLRMAAATLVRSDGSTPHQLGLALVTNESGDTVGALSRGCVDADIVLACDRVLAGGPAEVLTFGAAEEEFGTGLACGGVITVWVHELSRAAAEAITGASYVAVLTRYVGGHVQQHTVSSSDAMDYENSGVDAESPRCVAARWLVPEGGQAFLEGFGRRRLFVVVGSSGYTEALCAQAALMGYDSVVVEPRPRFAAGITCANEVIGAWPDEVLEKLSEHGRLDGTSAIVVCTHDPKFDEPALAAALATPTGYIGALGSRATNVERFPRLRTRGIPEEALHRINAPVGLDLGGATPAETAVSVAAQIIAVTHGRNAAPLRETSGPIHAR